MNFAALHHFWALVIIIQEPESETSLESWEQHWFMGQAEARAKSSSQEFLLFYSYSFIWSNSLNLTVLKNTADDLSQQ